VVRQIQLLPIPAPVNHFFSNLQMIVGIGALIGFVSYLHRTTDTPANPPEPLAALREWAVSTGGQGLSPASGRLPKSSTARSRYGDAMRAVRIGLPITVLFVVASATAVAVPLLRASVSASAPDEQPAVEFFACAQVVSSGDDYCKRIADDLGRRAPLT
jgi:hypothetical protein